MTLDARRATILAMTLTVLAGLAAAQPQAPVRQTAAPRSDAPADPARGASLPVHEPMNCESAELRREQAERREMRRLLDWNALDDDAKESFWDEAVGPDQLNDGHGFAELRPSLRQNGFGPRDDPFDSRGINLVLLSWAYTTQGAAGSADTWAFDMDLNVYGNVSFTGSLVSPDGTTRVKSTELRGVADSTEGYTKNWDQVYNMNPGAAGYLEGKACASDLSGNLYWGGLRGNGRYHLAKLNSANGGARLADADFLATTTATDCVIYSLVVDPEGILYAAGTYLEGAARRCFVARHEPDATLTRTWIQTFDQSSGQPVRLMTDRRGVVYLMNTAAGNVANVRRLSPYDGAAEWTWSGAAGSQARAFDLDFAGTPHVVAYTGAATNDWQTSKLDPLDGHALWQKTVTNGSPADLKVDGKGNVFVLGSKGNATARLVKYDAAGVVPAAFVQPSYGTTGAASKLALDWIGNPYVCITFGTAQMSTDTRKFDPTLGAVPGQGDNGEVWHYYLSPVFSNAEVNGQVDVEDFLVDASGSVYVCGQRDARSASNNAHLSQEFFFIKYEQPYTSIPKIARSNPVVAVNGNSLWRPASSGDLSGWSNRADSIFSVNAAPLMNNIDSLTQVDVDYGVGTAGGGLDLTFHQASFGLSFETNITGGTYNSKVTGELAIAIPGPEELTPGDPFTVTVNFDPDASGMELTTDGRPQLAAGLYGSADLDLDADIFGYDTFLGSFRQSILPSSPDLGSLHMHQELVGLDLLAGNIEPGTWVDLGDMLPPVLNDFVGGTLRMPDMGTKGAYSDGTGGPTLTSHLSEPFLTLEASLTNALAVAAGLPPPEIGWGTPVGTDLYDAEVGASLLQATLEGTLSIEQDFTLVMRPYVDLAFDSNQNSPQRVYMDRVQDSEGRYTYQGSATLTLPANDGTLEIRPTFGVRATSTNDTGFRFGATAAFKPVELAATLQVAGTDVIDLDFTPGALSWDLVNGDPSVSSALNGGRFDIPHTGANGAFPASQTFDFPNEAALAYVQVASTSTDNKPQLIGASRAALRMAIYEQRTPTQAEFNAAAVGDVPMVLYGRQLPVTPVTTAYLQHHGRTEALATTRLNGQALLVQVPKRFLLLPGIARVWLNNSRGSSESIDLPIEYPMPNFQGLLDKHHDPAEIWASDPRWINDPVIPIDGGTPAGLDSFIARRDYYTLMRTTFWPAAFPGLGTAQAYFPGFPGWETGGTACPPGFPTLQIDGESLALGTHTGSEDGYLLCKMQESVYALPHTMSMSLSNPGPGGGAGRTQLLDVPAARPTARRITPEVIRPNTVTDSVRVTIYGPLTAPYFPGYESPKFGNFTPGSTVYLNTTPLATEFVHSGKLVATVPASLLTTFGARLISVRTPAGASGGPNIQFFEELRNGSGAVVSSGMVDGGGASVPLTLNVMWPAPVISSVSHPRLTVGQPPRTPVLVNGEPPADDSNFSIVGRNFSPDARVLWNGTRIPATRVSEGLIRLNLTAAQVAEVGQYGVTVVNPGSSGSARQSQTVVVRVNP